MSNRQPTPLPDVFTPILATVPVGFFSVIQPTTTDQQTLLETKIGEELALSPASWMWHNKLNQTISIDQVRQIIFELQHASLGGKIRVIAIQAADLLTLPAQHAFLKSLEEPPQRTLLVLFTESPQQLLETIQSRCRLIKLDVSFTTSPLPTDQANHVTTLVDFISGQKSLSFGKISQLTDTLKDRATAIAVIDAVLVATHKQLRKQLLSSAIATTAINQLLQIRSQLQANGQVQLTLESGLFAIKRLLKN